jgi:tetratricopeptide (TPR) repeat protein
MGELAVRRGTYDEAEGYCQESIRLGEQTESAFALSYAPLVLARVAYHRGEYESARQFYEGAVATVEKDGSRHELMMYRSLLGDVALAMGDLEGAQESHQRAREPAKEMAVPWMEAAAGEHYGLAYSLDRLGEIALAVGDVRRARETYQQALLIARDYPLVTLHLDVVVSQAALLAHEGREERAAELAALALHHPRSHVEVTKRAQKLLEDLEARLPPDVFAAAQGRGRARGLEATVQERLGELESEPELRS